MNRLVAWCTGLTICGATGLALGRAPLIDPPTPPPCAADGTCYPKTGEWGWYQSRWRTWPGDQLEPTPSTSPTAAGQVSPELSNSETPPADLEDAAAPPSSPKRDEAEEAAPVPGGEPPSKKTGESSLPNVPLPDAETPSPLGPTTDQDPPPALPKSLTSRLSVPGPQQALPGQRQATRVVGSRSATAGVSTNDPPPAPPWAQSAAL